MEAGQRQELKPDDVPFLTAIGEAYTCNDCTIDSILVMHLTLRGLDDNDIETCWNGYNRERWEGKR